MDYISDDPVSYMLLKNDAKKEQKIRNRVQKYKRDKEEPSRFEDEDENSEEFKQIAEQIRLL